jgi:ABC-type glycerol-3-phosphate transport system substrate-binding protein
MNKSLSLIALGLCGLLIVGCQGKGGDNDDNEMTVSMSDVPEAVRASFEKTHPGATVQKIEKETHADGTAEYEFEFTQDGKKGEVELDQTGAVAAEDKD